MSQETFADRVAQRLQSFTEALERGETPSGVHVFNKETGKYELSAYATQWHYEDDSMEDAFDDLPLS